MARLFKILLACALAFSALSAYSQSLGDVARQQRANNVKNANQTHKVVTDEDMPDHPSSDSDKTADASANTSSDAATHSSTNDKLQTGEEWKSVIGQQKQAIAEMQSQLDKLNASIHYVEANRYSNGVEYNQHQAQKQKEADREQAQLDEQKKRLSEMQEKARSQGFSSTVYDP